MQMGKKNVWNKFCYKQNEHQHIQVKQWQPNNPALALKIQRLEIFLRWVTPQCLNLTLAKFLLSWQAKILSVQVE